MNLRFVFISCCVDEEFFDAVKKGMRDAAALMSVDCSFIGTEDVDISEQIAMVRNAIADKYDGIALNIIDITAFDEVVHEAAGKGIPVVGFNVDTASPLNKRLSNVCQDLYQAGCTLGQHINPYIPDHAQILVTLHSEGISALEDRRRGALDALQEKKVRSRSIVTGIEPRAAAEKIAGELSDSPDTRVILCTGQADTEGAGLAVEELLSEQSGFTVAGFDMSPEILRLVKKGIIQFTIDQQPYVQGFYPVMQLTQYCRYGILPSDMNAGATVVRQDDVDRLLELNKAGYR